MRGPGNNLAFNRTKVSVVEGVLLSSQKPHMLPADPLAAMPAKGGNMTARPVRRDSGPLAP
jgi:hypothetical protein